MLGNAQITSKEEVHEAYLGAEVENEDIVDSTATSRLESTIEYHSLRVNHGEGKPLARGRLGASDHRVGP